MKASQIQAPEDFDGEISFEINSQAPGTWKETCVIFQIKLKNIKNY